MEKRSVEESVERWMKMARKSAAAPFGAGWAVLPRELRALYVHRAVLGIISGIVEESASPELCLKLIALASEGIREEG